MLQFEKLSRAEMKNVVGGFVQPTCRTYTSEGPYLVYSDNCMTMAQASATSGVHYCCDSCASHGFPPCPTQAS